MAAYNAETTLARALHGRYARAGDVALTTSGDIHPGPGVLHIRLDPLTAPRRTQALAALCGQLTVTGARYPGTDLIPRYEANPGQALHKRSPYVGSHGASPARHARGPRRTATERGH